LQAAVLKQQEKRNKKFTQLDYTIDTLQVSNFERARFYARYINEEKNK
jgi:hypothetical protein